MAVNTRVPSLRIYVMVMAFSTITKRTRTEVSFSLETGLITSQTNRQIIK